MCRAPGRSRNPDDPNRGRRSIGKTIRTKAYKSDQPLEDDLSADNLEPAFAVSDSKITVRRDGDKVVVSVPVRFYRRNGRQMILAECHEPESNSTEAAVPNNALLTALAKAYAWQEQLESAGGNRAAELEVDVRNDAISGLGSPICSAFCESPDVLAIEHETNALLESSSVKKSVRMRPRQFNHSIVVHFGSFDPGIAKRNRRIKHIK
jgi:hypothetical protein